MDPLISSTLVIGIYLIPAIIAASNRKRNWLAIFVVNLLLGWTLIGWIVALVWALMYERVNDNSQDLG